MVDFSDKVENDSKKPADMKMFSATQKRDDEGWMKR